MNNKTERTEYMVLQGCTFRQSNNMQYREEKDGETDNTSMIIEGIAIPFDNAASLYSYNGIDVKELIDKNAFNEADMSDVVFNYNHGGKVIARTRNNTLSIEIKSDGLHIRAILSGTDEGKAIYNEIKGGYIDKMSVAFRIEKDSYNVNTNTYTILKVSKLYDVSAVDFPAYDATSVSARNAFSAVVEKTKKAEAIELRKKVLQTTLNENIKLLEETA